MKSLSSSNQSYMGFRRCDRTERSGVERRGIKSSCRTHRPQQLATQIGRLTLHMEIWIVCSRIWLSLINIGLLGTSWVQLLREAPSKVSRDLRDQNQCIMGIGLQSIARMQVIPTQHLGIPMFYIYTYIRHYLI